MYRWQQAANKEGEVRVGPVGRTAAKVTRVIIFAHLGMEVLSENYLYPTSTWNNRNKSNKKAQYVTSNRAAGGCSRLHVSR